VLLALIALVHARQGALESSASGLIGEGDKCNLLGRQGVCTAGPCVGSKVSNKCRGPTEVKCCIPPNAPKPVVVTPPPPPPVIIGPPPPPGSGPILNFTPFTSLSPGEQSAFNKKCAFCYSTENKVKPQWDANLSPQRKKILEYAESYIRAVSDCGGQGNQKWGAETLVQIYRDAFQAKYQEALGKQLRLANNKKWKNGPWSWCGIWAVAAARNAGVTDIQWGIGKMEGRKLIYGSKGIQPGDLAIWKGALNHHNIIEKIEGDVVYSIDGNSMCSSIMRKKKSLRDIAGYYNLAGNN